MVTVLQESKEAMKHRPSISPVRRGWISSRYGMRKDPFTGRQMMHRGVDFSAWTGTPVYATANGTVRKAGRNGTLGLMVEIDHGNGIYTRYGHNSRIVVKVGHKVKRGDKIAEVGSTGRSTSPHCHYEVRVDRQHVNPWRFILDGGPTMDGEA
jgi:murein DD-endopeptidase MepM/ murein hydrolase activator NlpD